MRTQRCKTADFGARGEPGNEVCDKENVLVDSTIVCPTCEGSGLLPSVRHSQMEVSQIRNLLISRNKVSYSSSDTKMSLPKSLSKPRVPRLPTMYLPTLKGTGCLEEKCPPINTKTLDFLETETVGQAKKRTEKLIRCALLKLSSHDWELKKEGLEECSQITHHSPDEMDMHMNQVYSAMRHLLGNHRPRDTMFVCQVARMFFARLRSTCRPEFDNFVMALLVRTADSSFYIRCYVNDALDKMVTYIPSLHAIRPLVNRGCKHRNPLVRTSAIRLLTDIVTFRTPVALLTHPHLRESCKKIMVCGAQLLADNSLGTRAAAKNLFTKFVHEEGFESMYEACNIDGKLKKRIAQSISALKQNQKET